MRLVLALLLVSGVGTLLPAQSLLIVDDDGGAGVYTDIAPALVAAVAGDVILVRPGSYNAFIVDKGVRVLADAGAIVQGDGTGRSMVVQRLPAGQSAVVRGLVVDPATPGEVELTDNNGLVHVEAAVVPLPMRIVRCTQVALHFVTLEGAPALEIVDSTVAAAQCRFDGKSGGNGMTVAGSSSRVSFAGGSVQGASGSNLGAALYLDSGDVFFGGADTIVAAGASWSGSGPPTPAIASIAGNLTIDPVVYLAPSGGANAIEGGANYRFLSVPSTRAGVTNGVLTATVHGTPGFAVVLVGGGPLTPSLPSPFRDLWVDPFSIGLYAGSIGIDGTVSTTVPLPPQAHGTVAALQALVLWNDQFLLSTPVLLTID